jgi:hypothetical protein
VTERASVDRRATTWRTIVFSLLRGRRHRARRVDDPHTMLLDAHEPSVFFFGITLMVLCVADAFFTLQMLATGAAELNPFMRRLIEWNVTGFVLIKFALTAIGIILLVFASRAVVWCGIRVHALLIVHVAIYACLVCYEIASLY